MAVLLFPFGLRLGLMLQCPRGYWPVLLGAEWLLIYWLMQAVGLTHFSLLMIGSLLTLLPVARSRAIAINVTGAPCCYRVRR